MTTTPLTSTTAAPFASISSNNAPLKQNTSEEPPFSLSTHFAQSQAFVRGGGNESSEIMPFSQRVSALSLSSADLQKENSVLKEAFSALREANAKLSQTIAKQEQIIEEQNKMIASHKEMLTTLEIERNEQKQRAIVAEQKAVRTNALLFEEKQKSNRLETDISKFGRALTLLLNTKEELEEKTIALEKQIGQSSLQDRIIGAGAMAVCVVVIVVAKAKLSN